MYIIVVHSNNWDNTCTNTSSCYCGIVAALCWSMRSCGHTTLVKVVRTASCIGISIHFTMIFDQLETLCTKGMHIEMCHVWMCDRWMITLHHALSLFIYLPRANCWPAGDDVDVSRLHMSPSQQLAQRKAKPTTKMCTRPCVCIYTHSYGRVRVSEREKRCSGGVLWLLSCWYRTFHIYAHACRCDISLVKLKFKRPLDDWVHVSIQHIHVDVWFYGSLFGARELAI